MNKIIISEIDLDDFRTLSSQPQNRRLRLQQLGSDKYFIRWTILVRTSGWQ